MSEAEFDKIWAQLEEKPLAKACLVAVIRVGGHQPGGEAAGEAARAAVQEAVSELLALQMKFRGLFGDGWLEILVDLLREIVNLDDPARSG